MPWFQNTSAEFVETLVTRLYTAYFLKVRLVSSRLGSVD